MSGHHTKVVRRSTCVRARSASLVFIFELFYCNRVRYESDTSELALNTFHNEVRVQVNDMIKILALRARTLRTDVMHMLETTRTARTESLWEELPVQSISRYYVSTK